MKNQKSTLNKIDTNITNTTSDKTKNIANTTSTKTKNIANTTSTKTKNIANTTSTQTKNIANTTSAQTKNIAKNIKSKIFAKSQNSTRTPHENYLWQVKKKKIEVIFAQIAILLAFLVMWELFAQLKIIDSFFFSSPLRILKMFKTLLDQQIFMHIGTTLLECILGFAISTILGLAIAIALWWSSTLRRILEPYLVVLNSLPKIALGPIIIIWVGAGIKAIVMMAILICIIVTVISLINGFLSCDKDKILLLESMGATKFQILYKLILPYSIPNILAVLKINVGLAWVGTIMGEYLVSGAGLGYLIIFGGQVFKLDLVMASTVILCFLAGLMYLIVAFLEKWLTRHR